MKNKTTFLGKGNHDIIVNGQATKKKKNNWFTIPAVFSTGGCPERKIAFTSPMSKKSS